jgi:1-acyl-sn-glycerol-3-phosphate acyltransferase
MPWIDLRRLPRVNEFARQSRGLEGRSSVWLLPYQVVVLVLFSLVTLFTEVICFLTVVWDRRGATAHNLLRYWARSCLVLARLEVHVCGLERLDPRQAYVFMANHGSFLDILLALAYIPHDFRFIILWKLFFNPFLSLALRSSGQIPIDPNSPRQSLRALRHAMSLLKQQVSIVVFPEGTRSRTGDLQAFKTMLFVLPTRAGVPVVPVLIEGAFTALRRGCVLIRPVGLRLTFLEPVVAETQDLDRSVYAARVRDALRDAALREGIDHRDTEVTEKRKG